MTITGIIIGIILAVSLPLLFGPTGGVLLLGLIFGLIFSTYIRNKLIYEDLQLIKEKLGIADVKEEFEMIDEQDMDRLNKVNSEIEKELEEHHREINRPKE